jgi:hypothetical protein
MESGARPSSAFHAQDILTPQIAETSSRSWQPLIKIKKGDEEVWEICQSGSIERASKMTDRTLLVALCLLLCNEPSALSKGSSVGKDDPWNPSHIDSLPADIRQYIAGLCKGSPRAQHDFATFSPQEKRWRINLEYLQCDGLGEYRRGNRCLDVDFVEAGSRFRLARKEYRDCGF